MRLTIITSEFPPGPGGIGTHAHALASGLTDLGWQVAVIAGQDYVIRSEIRDFNRRQPFEVVPLPRGTWRPWSTVQQAHVLQETAFRSRPDLVLASGKRALWMCGALLPLAGVRWVAAVHGSEFTRNRTWSQWLTRTALARASYTVAVSHYTRQRMANSGISTSRCGVIHNGADPVRFSPWPPARKASLRRRMGLPSGPLLLSVGHLSKRKGQDVVIRALPRILKEVPSANYLMAGLATRKAEYQELARQLGVANNVHFLGHVQSSVVPGLMNVSELLVMPSRDLADDAEGFGIAAIEAALCGTPTVASSAGGLSEAIEDQRTGWLTPPDGPNEMARAICSLLTDPRCRRAMGAAAHDRALRGQTWAHCAAKYDSLLRGLVRARSTHLDLAPSAA